MKDSPVLVTQVAKLLTPKSIPNAFLTSSSGFISSTSSKMYLTSKYLPLYLGTM